MKLFQYSTSEVSNSGSTDQLQVGRPIADLYDNTTIFFADLVGFTSWSAKRNPVEVFDLLESIYGRFDKIALRRKVFKVETVCTLYCYLPHLAACSQLVLLNL